LFDTMNYYKYIDNSNNKGYAAISRSLLYGRKYIFAADYFNKVKKIKFIGTTNTSISMVKNNLKIYQETRTNEVQKIGKPYVIESNMILQKCNLDAGSIVYFLDQIENHVGNLNYVDVSLSMQGNPNINAGDFIELHTKNGVYDTYVMRRTLSGIKSLTDSIEAK